MIRFRCCPLTKLLTSDSPKFIIFKVTSFLSQCLFLLTMALVLLPLTTSPCKSSVGSGESRMSRGSGRVICSSAGSTNTNTNTNTYANAQSINTNYANDDPPPMPSLSSSKQLISKLGQINVMILTDVHSWVGGHLPHEPKNDANYGDILSFYEHLQQQCNQRQKDLFFVMNGDFVDGTGLSTDPPKHLIPILQQMPWDAVNIGNHELYKNSTIDYITQKDGFVDSWNGRYLTSNVLHATSNEPIGSRYRFLHAKHSNKTILTFGFLYNFQRHCKNTIVEQVDTVLNSTWFRDVLLTNNNSDNNNNKENHYHAIMVLAHMGHDDPLVDLILQKIRDITGDMTMPVQFITGHTHIRAYRQLDYYSTSFEAGRYLDTIGLVSFPTKNHTDSDGGSDDSDGMNSTIDDSTTKRSAQPSNPPTLSPSISYSPTLTSYPTTTTTITTTNTPTENPNNDHFMHEFIDTSVSKLKEYIGVKTLRTENGTALSKLIQQTQESLGLLEILGCSPRTYYVDNAIENSDSLWGFYIHTIIPQQLFGKLLGGGGGESSSGGGGNNVFIQGTGSFRYSLFIGNITVDDLISMSPFNDAIHLIDEKIKGQDIFHAFGKPNQVEPNSSWPLPSYALAGPSNIVPSATYNVYSIDFDVNYVTEKLEIASNKTIIPKKMIPEITTEAILKGYIHDNWVCEKKKEENQDSNFFSDFVNFFEEFTALKAIAFILTFVIIMFFGYMFVCRSPNTSMFSDRYDESDLSMIDDISIGEFSDSETSQNSSTYMPKGSPSLSSIRTKKHLQYHSFEPSSSEMI